MPAVDLSSILHTCGGYAIRIGSSVLDDRFDTVAEALAHAATLGRTPVLTLGVRYVDWRVPAYRVEAIQAIVAEINKKAAKRGTGGAQVSFGAPYTTKVEIATASGDVIKADRVVRRMQAFVETPKIAGWHFRAVLDHTLWTAEAPANVISTRDREFALPDGYRTAAPTCDHCGKVRRRGKTVVVQHDSGAIKQIGLTCMEAYLGSDPLGGLAALASFDELGRACDGEEDEGFAFSKSPRQWPLGEYLAAVATCIRVDGWMSRKLAEDKMTTATADNARDLLTAWRKGPETKIERDALARYGGGPSLADCAEATAAWEWCKAIEASSDYDHNLRTIAHAGFVAIKWIGLAASMVAAYQRDLNRRAAEAAKAARGDGGVHLGKIGERLELEVEVIGSRTIEGYYGATQLLKFQADDGSQLMTFASGSGLRVPDGDSDREIKIGDKIRIRGTVKDHKSFQGQAETQLSRVALAPPPKAKKARKAA